MATGFVKHRSLNRYENSSARFGLTLLKPHRVRRGRFLRRILPNDTQYKSLFGWERLDTDSTGYAETIGLRTLSVRAVRVSLSYGRYDALFRQSRSDSG
jgi:hypothetical protein